MIAVMAACLLFLGWHIDQQNKDLAHLKIENKSFSEALDRAAVRAKRDADTLVANEAEKALQTRKLDHTQQALSEALQRNKTWSDTDVPEDVQKALSGPSDGLADGL